MRPPTISGLDYFNSATRRVLHLSTASVEYLDHTGSNIKSCILGKVALAVPGYLPHSFSLFYEADHRYSALTLHTNNAIEYLMAF